MGSIVHLNYSENHCGNLLCKYPGQARHIKVQHTVNTLKIMTQNSFKAFYYYYSTGKFV